jgi:hypothetical protein
MTSRAHDHPGPHPENQRKRRELQGARNSLIGVLAAAAVFAVAGGLARAGVLTATVLGGSQAFAAVLLIVHHPRARAVALAAALFAMVWSGVQIVMLDHVPGFQGAMLGIGALEGLLVAGATPREDPTRKKKMRRRR